MIGVFDSGFGGLTVFKEIEIVLPQYDYIYLGDNARAPYGDHSPEIIYRYTKQAVDYLRQQGCRLVVIACNTASADALPKLQEEYGESVKILGVIWPALEAVQERGWHRVGLLATRSTVASGKYTKVVKEIEPTLKIIPVAAPLLVPLIEEGVQQKPWARKIIKGYVQQLKSQNVEAIILGCTHYGIIKKEIGQYAGAAVTVLDVSHIVAAKLQGYLERHPELAKALSSGGTRRFLTTDAPKRFNELGRRFLGRAVQAEQITLS